MNVNYNTSQPPLDVFVHVPKTAGTSLRSLAITHYGADNTYIFHGRTGLLSPAREANDYANPHVHERNIGSLIIAKVLYASPPSVHALALRARNKLTRHDSEQKAYDTARAVIGHFSLEHFTAAAGDKRPTNVYTVVRDPLQRMRSHYNYGRQLLEIGQSQVGWTEGQDFTLPFEQFALSGAVSNFQSRFTGTNPDRYQFIGTTERFDGFLRRLGLIDSDTEVPHYNKTDEQFTLDDHALSPGFLSEFRDFHQLDYDFYDAAQSRQVPSSSQG